MHVQTDSHEKVTLKLQRKENLSKNGKRPAYAYLSNILLFPISTLVGKLLKNFSWVEFTFPVVVEQL